MKVNKYVDCQTIQNLIEKYVDAGGIVVEIIPGCLGYGTILLLSNGNNLKEFVIEEYYLNEWSSGHRLLTYNKGISKKYKAMLEKYEDGYEFDYEKGWIRPGDIA